MGLRESLRRWRAWRRARRLLDAAFRARTALASTSLHPEHAGRTVVLDLEHDAGDIARIHFGILRHPRPYAFSRQHHEVVEYYVYEVAAQRMVRLRGVNLTRHAGEDAGR